MRKSLKSFLPKLLKVFIVFNILLSQSLPIVSLFAEKAYADTTGSSFIQVGDDTTPYNGIYLKNSDSPVNIVVEALLDGVAPDRVALRYADSTQTCHDVYTSPYPNPVDLDLLNTSGNIYETTTDWNISALTDGEYKLCVLLHANPSAGWKAENAFETTVTIDNTSSTITPEGWRSYLAETPITSGYINGNTPYYTFNTDELISLTGITGTCTNSLADVNFGNPSGYNYYLQFRNNVLVNGTEYSDCQIEVTDLSGNTTTHTLYEITYDNTNPLGTIINPLNNTYIKGTVALSMSALDDFSGMNRVAYFINGTWLNASYTVDTDGYYTYNWNTTSVTDGSYEINYRPRDNAGNVDATSYVSNVFIDNTAPVLTVDLSPTTDNTPTIVVTITETNLDTLTVNVDSTDYPATVVGTNYSVDIPTELSDGDHSVTVTATDLAGNTATVSGTLTVDATPPYVFAGTDKITNTAIPIADATFDAGIIGLDSFSWSTTGGTLSDWTSTSDHLPTFSAIVDGTYTLTFEVTDLFGRTSNDTVDVIWDTTPPVTTIVSPLDGDYINGTVALVGDIDELHMMRYYYRIRNTTTNQVVTSKTVYDTLENEVFYTWNTTGVTDGVYEIHLAARDLADNRDELVSVDSILVTVDNTSPVITFTDDVSATPVQSDTIEINVSEVNPDTTTYEYAFTDGTCDSTVAFTSTFTSDLPFVIDNETYNGYYICATSTDLAGNTSYQLSANALNIDITPPTITWITPETGTFFANTPITLSASSNETLTNLRFLWRTPDEGWDSTNRSYNNNTDGTYYMYDFLPTEDGVYYLRAQGRDLALNWNRATPDIKIIVDTTKPTIDTTEDMVLDEGEMLNLGFLDDKAMRDNIALDSIYITFNYSGTIGGNVINENLLNNEQFDVSMAGCDYDANHDGIIDDSDCGIGGTLNELFDYEMSETITFGDYELPIDTSLLQEGTYTFNYYVTDKAGNRSDCDTETAGDQNCEFSITINNVAPQVTFGSNQTINEGGIATFTASFTDPSTVSLIDYLSELGLFEGEDIYTTLSNILDSEDLDEIEANLIYSLMYGDDSPWYATIDYGLGNGETYLGQFTSPGAITIPNMLYTHADIYTVTLKVCETTNDVNLFSENKCTTKTVNVTVNNVTPSVIIYSNQTNDNGTVRSGSANVLLTSVVRSGNAPFTYQWGGVCSGTESTTSVSLTPGSYYCRVTVTDVDGDVASAGVTVVINAEGNLVYPGTGETTPEETSEEENKTDDDGTVLGTETQRCETTQKVSGYVYEDKNKNEKKDSREKGYANVTVVLEYEYEGKTYEVRVETNEDGYWETSVCPGKYTVRLSEQDIPEGYVLGEEQKITVTDRDELADINLGLINEKQSNMNLWWILLIVLVLAVLVMIFLSLFRKEKN